jgi:hypothetical protein
MPLFAKADIPTEAMITGCWKSEEDGGGFGMRLLVGGIGESVTFEPGGIGFKIYWEIDPKTGWVGTEVAGTIIPRELSWMRYDAESDSLISVRPDTHGRHLVYRRADSASSWCVTGEWVSSARTHVRGFRKGFRPRTEARKW